MSFEIASNINENPIPSNEDIQAALELIAEDEELRNHPRVNALVANDFVTEDGRQLDPGNFLAAVKEALERAQTEESTETYSDRIERVMAAMTIHSDATR